MNGMAGDAGENRSGPNPNPSKDQTKREGRRKLPWIEVKKGKQYGRIEDGKKSIVISRKPCHDYPSENQLFDNRGDNYNPENSSPNSKISVEKPGEQLHKPSRRRKDSFKMDADFVQKVLYSTKGNDHCGKDQQVEHFERKHLTES